MFDAEEFAALLPEELKGTALAHAGEVVKIDQICFTEQPGRAPDEVQMDRDSHLRNQPHLRLPRVGWLRCAASTSSPPEAVSGPFGHF